MTKLSRLLARASLVLLWLHTALVSFWELNGRSAQLLMEAGVDGTSAQAVIVAGAGLDLLLGLALWLKHSALVYGICGLALLAMTVIGSILLPELWLHPLGPLSKNLPIAALLYLLYGDARK